MGGSRDEAAPAQHANEGARPEHASSATATCAAEGGAHEQHSEMEMAANLASLQYNREEEIREGRAAQHGDAQYDEFGFERRSPNYDEYEEYPPDEDDDEREPWGRK